MSFVEVRRRLLAGMFMLGLVALMPVAPVAAAPDACVVNYIYKDGKLVAICYSGDCPQQGCVPQ